MMARSTAIFAAAVVLAWVLALHARYGPAVSEAMQPQNAQPAEVRFEAVDIYIDSGEKPLAAYQIEVRAIGGEGRLVGIEGGEHSPFAMPPYYDPRALHDGQINERVVIAALSTAEELPTGRTRLARLHMAVRGEVEYRITVEAAGGQDGERIETRATVEPAEPPSSQ